jgi:hypothetical protein
MGELVPLEAVAAEYRVTRGQLMAVSSVRLRRTARRMASHQPDPADRLDLARRAAVRDELIARGERLVLP